MKRAALLFLACALLSFGRGDTCFDFGGSARVTLARSPFGQDVVWHAAFQMHDLQHPTPSPEYKNWYQISIVPDDPSVIGKLYMEELVTPVHATATKDGHMILEFSEWKLDITPADPTLRQRLSTLVNGSDTGDVGIQTLVIMTGTDSLTITGTQPVGAQGAQFPNQKLSK